jgi:ankyrin repeat protein
VSVASSKDNTALMYAVSQLGHAAVVAWLLGEGGAAGTLEVQNKDGDTAFLAACAEGQLECAQALAAAGCDVAAACSDGTTALMRAAGEGNTVVLAWLLGEGGAAGTLEARNNHGCTAFLLACVLGQLECVELLARAGCDMDVETGMHHITGNALEQTADHDAVVVRLRELKAERAAATQRREVEEMTAAYKEFQYNK